MSQAGDAPAEVVPSAPPPVVTKPLVAGSWVLYDVANTVYAGAITYLLVPHVREHYHDLTSVGVTQTISMVLSGIAVPVLAALSDRTGRSRLYLIVLTLVAIVAMAAWSITPNLLLLMLCFGIANFAYNSALVFYNSLLASVATPEREGLISGLGVGLGYLGTLLVLFALVFNKEALGGSAPTFALGAALFLVLALPCFILVKERRVLSRERASAEAIRLSLRQIGGTLKNLRHNRRVGYFLLGNFFCIDVLNTAILYFVVYALAVYAGHAIDLGFASFDLRMGLAYGNVDPLTLSARFVQPGESGFTVMIGASLIVCALIMGLVTGWLCNRIGALRTMLLSAVGLFGAVIGCAVFIGNGPESWEMKRLSLLALRDSDQVFERQLVEDQLLGDSSQISTSTEWNLSTQRASIDEALQLPADLRADTPAARQERWSRFASEAGLEIRFEGAELDAIRQTAVKADSKGKLGAPDLLLSASTTGEDAISAHRPLVFYLLVVLFGGVGLAGIWTAGRKLLMDLAPRAQLGEYFGLYGITVKLSVIGSTVFVVVLDNWGARFAMLAIAIPLGIGIALLLRVGNGGAKSSDEVKS